MRRSNEFKKFLSCFFKKKTVENYVCYGNAAERILGRDLDDIVFDFDEIAKAWSKLLAEPSYVKKVKGLSGCTQLGDGSIALILDGAGLID